MFVRAVARWCEPRADCASMPHIDASWYDYPQYFDLAFRSETRAEANFIEAACGKYCAAPVRRLLEPGCGTGRLIVELADRKSVV